MLDLFCGAGGAAMGYSRAGFTEIVGVDIKPQPHYPFTFIQADAMTHPLEGFDAIHASPPCQAFTPLRKMWNARGYPDLVTATRERLMTAGVPWAMENVVGAPFLAPIILCGSMFRLGCDGAELRRHRYFETSFPLMSPSTCVHGWSASRPDEAITVGVYGHAGGLSKSQRYAVIGVYGGHGRDRRRIRNGQHFSTAKRAEAMGIDWMTGAELSQAIPPAYTEFIGKALMAHLAAPREAQP